MKNKLGEKAAEDLITFVRTEVSGEFNKRKETLATKTDITELKQNSHDLEIRLTRSIYIMGLVQFLAIIDAVLAIINFKN
ncbi:hypothetical protein [Hufsiella ginkgonis]|uniref:Uncharacterized protein n=1 Tax=Hufsiella ginkgonis TaxID=2695274 RepID=A0A7K1Y3I3_9SPHI|nr:hypothetical protein [Hufsiella ginkgonis]MXV17853.1 hypothetical protein [Hufsiella ginkgonis]